MKKSLVIFVLALASLVFASNAPSARERLRTLRQQGQTAYAAKDWAAARNAFQELRQFQNGSTLATYNLACVEALSGNKDEALRLLESIATTGQFIEPAKDDDFSTLRDDPRFQALSDRFKKNLEPISTSSTAYTIGDPELLTEDIAYDPQTRSFFITSILQKTITRIDTVRNKFSLFADLSKDPGWPLLAVAADPKRRILWVTAAAMPDFAASPKQDWGKDVLLKLDLKSGKILDRFSAGDSAQHAMGDMTLMRDGAVIVSDGLGGAIFRLRAGAQKLERIDAGEFISPQTPALSPDEKFVFVADYTRGIGRIDLASGAVSWLDRPDNVFAGGVDGLYLHGHDLYAAQNGTNPARIVRFHLNTALDRIESMDILESNSSGLGDPTHGVFVGNDFYFIANSGWSELDDHGAVKAGHKLTDATIRKLTVK